MKQKVLPDGSMQDIPDSRVPAGGQNAVNSNKPAQMEFQSQITPPGEPVVCFIQCDMSCQAQQHLVKHLNTHLFQSVILLLLAVSL